MPNYRRVGKRRRHEDAWNESKHKKLLETVKAKDSIKIIIKMLPQGKRNTIHTNLSKTEHINIIRKFKRRYLPTCNKMLLNFPGLYEVDEGQRIDEVVNSEGETGFNVLYFMNLLYSSSIAYNLSL